MALPSRITITEVGHPLCGRVAVLERERIADDGGWYRITDQLSAEEMDFAKEVLPFGLQVGDSRRQNTLLYPEQYKAA